MPGFDGTGPWGDGPGRGKGMGFCGYGQRRGGNRFCNGFNFRGRGFPYNQFNPSKEDQKSFLEAQLKEVEEEKKFLAEKIEELKKD